MIKINPKIFFILKALLDINDINIIKATLESLIEEFEENNINNEE